MKKVLSVLGLIAILGITSPAMAVKRGICYIPEDRKRHGLLLNKNVTENTILASLDKYQRFGFVMDRSASEDAEKINKKLRTKTPSMSQINPFFSLKLIIAGLPYFFLFSYFP